MESLNYHHLKLFQAVASTGHLTRASASLHLTPQTVSTQIRSLEAALGEPLFHRTGRRLVLSEAGRVALQYADEIFSLGRELQETLRGLPTGNPLRTLVGVTDALPKLIVHQLVEPALQISEPIQIVCHEGSPSELIADLAVHRLDVVLSDSPMPTSIKVKAYNHLLGSCGISFMARSDLAKRLRGGFPQSLHGAPVLLPTEAAFVRRELDEWFLTLGVRPKMVGEFEDSALLKSFGQAGEGFFAIPSVIEREVARQYEVEKIGTTEDVKESFYAISAERRVRHPAVVAICDTARSKLFS